MKPDATDLPTGPFDGLSFFEHLRAGLDAAAAQGWRELTLCDPGFAGWPLGERRVVDALQAWAGAGRSLLLLAQRFDGFEREHARFVQWRRMWSHLVDAKACHGPGLPGVPSGLWTPSWFVHRIDVERGRGSCSLDAVGRRRFRERIDECLRHAKSAFPATTLGL